MAQFQITIPDAELPYWIAAFSQGHVPDSGLTRPQWAKREIQAMLRGIVRGYRQELAKNEIPDSEATVT
jgi:hypothetical protein